MARAKKQPARYRGASASTTTQRRRISAALARGDFEQALRLAQALHKQTPTDQHYALLVQATLGRATQLRRAGQSRQAITLLQPLAEGAVASQELLLQCAGEFLLHGDWQTAQRLGAAVTDAVCVQRLLVRQVDAAVLQGEAYLVHLPEIVRPHAQAVLEALAAFDRADDAAARAAVAAIDQTSLLYDWKRLIEGLTVFYAASSEALDFWKSLHPERTPAAIAAPFRAQYDAAFLASQPPPVQMELLAYGRRLYTDNWVEDLEDVRRLLTHDNLPAALRQAGKVARTLPKQHQALRQRLARVMYWAMVKYGFETEIRTYKKHFGAPSDDPNLRRLQAMALESAEEFVAAQACWAKYEQEVAQHKIVRAADTLLARSLVWLHMGELAERADPPRAPQGPFSFLPGFDDLYNVSCAYSALECYSRSSKLAPQHLEAHERLLALLHTSQQPAEQVEAAQRLLAHFPEHERALGILATHAFRQGQFAEAVALQERAVRSRPHDAALTNQLQFFQLALARWQAQHGQFEPARALLQARLQQATADDRQHLLCRLAAVELKAGQAAPGEALFEEACQHSSSRLGTVFQMLVESLRMPLDAAWIKKLDRECRRGLRAKPDGASAVALLSLIYAFVKSNIAYDGLEEHTKLVIQYLKRARKVAFSAAQLEQLCDYLLVFPHEKLLLDFASRGRQLFPRHPAFPYAQVKYFISLGPDRCPMTKLYEALEAAQFLAQADPAYAEMAREIEQVAPALRMLTLAQQMGPLDMSAPPPPELLKELGAMLGLSAEELEALDEADLDDEWFLFNDDEPPWFEPPRTRGRKTNRKRGK